jgi:hypothetical protein
VVLVGGGYALYCDAPRGRLKPPPGQAAPTTAQKWAFVADATTGFRGFAESANARLRPDGNALLITASTTDPVLMLPELPSPGPGGLVLEFVIEPPTKTALQLFYLTEPGQEYGEDRTAAHGLTPGQNVVRVLLPAKAITSRIRFDPGFVEGDYKLYALRAAPQK